MVNIIEISASAIESVILTEFTTRVLGFKDKKFAAIKYIIYLLLSLFDITILPLFVESDIVPGIAHLILTFGFALLFLKGSIFFKLFIAILSNISILVINIIIMSIFSYFTRLNFSELIINQESSRALLVFTTKFVYFLFTRAMLKLFGKDKYPLTALNWYIIISLLLFSLASGLIVFGINLYTKFNVTFIVITTILIIVVNIATYVIMIALSKYNGSKNKITILERYKTDVDNKLEEIEARNKSTRKIRHELQNIGMMALTLIHEGKLEEANRILEDVANIDLGEDKHYIDLKYKMLETIINNKLTICEKENIKVNAIDFSGINESLQGIDESDLCTIICNLMDNAVEACQKCKGEKSISLTGVKEINYIKIRVANNAETTNLAYNGKALKTSKKDKASHGIGTQIINDLAIMYDGETYYKLKDNKFTATVYLSCANDVCKS